MRSSSLITLGFLHETVNDIGDYFNLNHKNSILRKDNTRLAFENYQLQDALLENIRLRKLLQFKYEVNYDLVPAKVIGYSPQDIVTGLILASDGISKNHKNNAVMTDEGLVGKIVKVSDAYAICQILLDPNNRISARVQRNRQLGMIKWDGANGFILDHIPNTIAILKGDVVFTSGLSQIYPANIKIGVVSKIEPKDQDLFQKIYVTPAVNFNRLEEVFIYHNPKANESGN